MPLYLTQYPAFLDIKTREFTLIATEGNLLFPGITYGMITAIEVNTPCRLRIYMNATYRDADLNRVLGDPRPENHGILFEGNFTPGNLALPVLPIASGNFQSLAYACTIPGVTANITTIKVF